MMKDIETSSRPREKIIHPYTAIATFHGGLENFIKRCKEEGQTTFTLSKLEFGNLTFLLKVFTLEGREITQVNVDLPRQGKMIMFLDPHKCEIKIATLNLFRAVERVDRFFMEAKKVKIVDSQKYSTSYTPHKTTTLNSICILYEDQMRAKVITEITKRHHLSNLLIALAKTHSDFWGQGKNRQENREIFFQKFLTQICAIHELDRNMFLTASHDLGYFSKITNTLLDNRDFTTQLRSWNWKDCEEHLDSWLGQISEFIPFDHSYLIRYIDAQSCEPSQRAKLLAPFADVLCSDAAQEQLLMIAELFGFFDEKSNKS